MQFTQFVLQSKRSASQIKIAPEALIYVVCGWFGAVVTVLLISLTLRTLG